MRNDYFYHPENPRIYGKRVIRMDSIHQQEQTNV